jgi:hypothetical protein
MEFAAECTFYPSLMEWDFAWNASPRRGNRRKLAGLAKIASVVELSLIRHGFRLFQNGGCPLLERHNGDLREEILFVPSPKMESRSDLPFSVQIHLSSKSIATVRSRFWRPAIRAPESIASANVGQFGKLPSFCMFSARAPSDCAVTLSKLLLEDVLPWFEVFHETRRLRTRLYEGSVPLVDDSTAIELLLAEFGSPEARKFLRSRSLGQRQAGEPISEIEGYDLMSDRVAPIMAYYRLYPEPVPQSASDNGRTRF